MKKIALFVIICGIFVSCQKKTVTTNKTSHSFKDGVLSVTCEKSPKSGICNYLIYKKNCVKSKIVEEKENVVCTFTKITEFQLKENESKTFPNLSENPEICMKTKIVPTLENCVKE